MRLALKVDVDTYDGMRDGVPNLLRLFADLKIKASFFIPFGPDQSGKAVFRIFKKKGFLKKMFRTNALKLYGFKTMLRGTLLPAPMIGASFPNLAKEILALGHELGIHGYNHVEWQDRLLEMNEEKIRDHYGQAILSFEKAVGTKPQAFAAPAWLCSPTSLKVQDELRFEYASDTRGQSPFYPEMGGTLFKTLQVPSTLPTTDELLGWDGITTENMNAALTQALKNSQISAHVHSIHTEVEGTALFKNFSKWLHSLQREKTEFVTVQSIAKEAIKDSKTPRARVSLGNLPGRAGAVALQN